MKDIKNLKGVQRRPSPCDEHHEMYSFYVEGLRSLEEYLRAPWARVCDVMVDAREVMWVRELLEKDLQGVPPWECEDFQIRLHLEKDKTQSSPHHKTADKKAKRAATYFRVEVPMWRVEALTACSHEVPAALIVVLDHLQDPRNVGAIVRSAAFFGASFVVVPSRGGVGMSEAVVRSSRGGLGHVRMVQVVNVGRTLEALKKFGYWVIGADMAGEELEGVSVAYDQVVLVLGSEGPGISRLVREKCDRIVRISGLQDGDASLNVSVAAGIFMYTLGKGGPF